MVVGKCGHRFLDGGRQGENCEDARHGDCDDNGRHGRVGGRTPAGSAPNLNRIRCRALCGRRRGGAKGVGGEAGVRVFIQRNAAQLEAAVVEDEHDVHHHHQEERNEEVQDGVDLVQDERRGEVVDDDDADLGGAQVHGALHHGEVEEDGQTERRQDENEHLGPGGGGHERQPAGADL